MFSQCLAPIGERFGNETGRNFPVHDLNSIELLFTEDSPEKLRGTDSPHYNDRKCNKSTAEKRSAIRELPSFKGGRYFRCCL